MSASQSTSGVSNSGETGIKQMVCKTEILFRVWTGRDNPGKLSTSEEAAGKYPGLVAFLQDVVSSRQGALVATEENMYVSMLENPTEAVVVARQVQLGMEEFKKRSRIQPVAVSIAIDARAPGALPSGADTDKDLQEPPKDQPERCMEASHDLLTLIKMSRPSQVLLTHELFQKANLFRGLPLRAFQGRFGVFEYLWTSEEKLLELEGEQSQFSESEPSLMIPSDRTELPSLPSRPASDEIGRTSFVHSEVERNKVEAKPFWASPLFIASAVGLLLIVLIAGGLAKLRSGPKVVSPAPQVIQRAPSPSDGASLKPKIDQPSPAHLNAAQSSVSTHKSDEKLRTARPSVRPKPDSSEESDIPVSAAPTPAPATAPAKTCTLQSNLDDYLRQAEYDRGRGDYISAERLFTRILDCDPNNERAKVGLSRTKAAKR
jgi:hypothetical protein